MAKWTTYDTVASARDVTSHFKETEQEDCQMHMLSLCINYGIGMKENVKTVKSTDPTATNCSKMAATEGSPLPGGFDVIKKLRALNNYLCTLSRTAKLTKIQEAHAFLQCSSIVDVNIRLASTCRLMRRSI